MASGQNINGLTVDDIFYFQYRQLPDALKQEVLDFMGYLYVKHKLSKPQKNKPKFGSAKGKYKMAADFDAPLDVFKEYME